MSSEAENEFKVNDYITLKLENGKTIIYVNNEPFEQCKFLLLNIEVDKITSLDKIESIDEASEKLNTALEPHEDKVELIPPETEFWGHCSNLQVWYENNYDTRLLHRNLAFPLLKKLAEVGDPIAKRVFQDEIYKRVNSGYIPIINFLYIEDYLDFLNRDEFIHLILTSDANVILELENLLELRFELDFPLCEYKHSIVIENKSVVQVALIDQGLSEIPNIIFNLMSLSSIYLSFNQIETIPELLTNYEKLEFLDLSFNKIEVLPDSIGNLKNLKKLSLRSNKLKKIPESIIKLELLEEIDIRDNDFKGIPKVLLELKDLHKNKKLKIKTYVFN